jgi:hypothetical protein
MDLDASSPPSGVKPINVNINMFRFPKRENSTLHSGCVPGVSTVNFPFSNKHKSQYH